MKRFLPVLVLSVAVLACVALVGGSYAAAAQAGAAAPFVPVTDAMLQHPDPGDWLMWRRTLNSWGYSPLTEITPINVRTLRMVWTRPLSPGLQEGTPLVYRGVLYFPNPSNLVQAFDAASGDLKWEYRRRLPEDLEKYFQIPSVNRNIAIYGNLIIGSSADDFVFALDAESGKLVWETKVLDYQKGGLQTAGPIIVNGTVVSGRSCQPAGGPEACVITAHDARTGKELWRTQTIPKPGEPGSETWGDVPYGERLHVGAWMVPSYDPELHLVYVGTSVTSPAPKYLLAGNNQKYLYNNSTLALQPDTGKIVWYYQHVVDHWDLDHVFERLLVDTAVAPDPREVPWINPRVRPGERRKVLTGVPGKTGLVYTLDRQTGEFLWARPTIRQTVISTIDGATGEVTVNPEAQFTKPGDTRLICPDALGGKNWEASSYSPLTNMMYVPMQNTCDEMTAVAESRHNTSLYGIANKPIVPKVDDQVGTIYAISAETGATAWRYTQRAGMTSVVATASGLLFAGDMNGRFRALDQRSGKVLWEINLGSSVTGYPAVFAVNGKEYIAVSTGTSASAGGVVGRLTPELRPGSGNNLFVFALP